MASTTATATGNTPGIGGTNVRGSGIMATGNAVSDQGSSYAPETTQTPLNRPPTGRVFNSAIPNSALYTTPGARRLMATGLQRQLGIDAYTNSGGLGRSGTLPVTALDSPTISPRNAFMTLGATGSPGVLSDNAFPFSSPTFNPGVLMEEGIQQYQRLSPASGNSTGLLTLGAQLYNATRSELPLGSRLFSSTF